MKKPYTLLAFVLLIALCIIPPIDFFITSPQDNKWAWMILAAGFMAFYFLFLEAGFFAKCLAVAIWFDCFFSSSPYESFTSFVTFTGCCYFYYACTRIEDWSIIFKGLQAVVLLTFSLMLMQMTGHDTILNFGYSHFVHYGIVGQHMQEASFGIVVCAMLIQYSQWYFIAALLFSIVCHSPWAFLCTAIGYSIQCSGKYAKFMPAALGICAAIFLASSFMMHKFSSSMAYSGRVPVWTKTIELSNKKPLTGWGISMYKVIFPVLGRSYQGGNMAMPYKTAHNFIAQLLFETGYPITIFVLAMILWLLFYLWVMGQRRCLSGAVMILSDALVHFPDRELQCVLIIIAFLAYINRRE